MPKECAMPQLICPKCEVSMHEWTSNGVTLDHCRECKGLWFDKGELSRHFANLGATVSEDDLQANRETHSKCPRCAGGPMIEARLDDVPVDACTRCHGVFLDLGEVHELMGAINRAENPASAETTGFDNFTLGLFIGANIGRDKD
jgi:Zn-finger nucleic acid-binding protein